MIKYFITFLLATYLMISCEKDINNTITKSINVLDGWEISKFIYDFDINPRDLFFVNDEIGFVVGYNGEIYKTTNAGKSWQKQNSGTTLHLHSVFFLDENIGFVAGQAMSGCLDEDCGKGSVFLKTTNGGETWSKIFFEDYTRIYCLKFFNDLKGLAIIHTPDVPNSRDYYIARTSDGGISWELIYLEIKPLYDKFYCVNDVVFIAGENQKIFKSIDYGYNWDEINTNVEAWHDIRGIYFINENIGFIDGITKIYKTIDGGSSWEIVDFPFTSFSVFHFYNENEGFNIEGVYVYEGVDFPAFKGSVSYQTKNGGISWTESDLNDSLHLGLTHFPRVDLGFAINGSEFYKIEKKD